MNLTSEIFNLLIYFSSAKCQSETFIVEKILDRRLDGKSAMYLVKWEGYDDSNNSWIPKRYFKSNKMVDDFNKEFVKK